MKNKLIQTIVIFGIFFISSVYADEGIKSDVINQDSSTESVMEKEYSGAKESAITYRKKLDQLITEEEKFKNEVDSYVRYIPSRKVDAQDGKVEVVDSEVQYSYDFKVFERLPVEISLIQQYISLENSTVVKLPAHLTGTSFAVETTLPFFNFENTYLRTNINPSFYDDDWNFHSSAFRIPVQAFLIRQPNEKLTWILGVAVYPDFEDKVLPIAGFIYKPNDKLVFNIVPRRPNITYSFNDKVSVFCEGEMTSGEFEVKKDDLKNVILQYQESHLGAGVEYQFNKYITTSISTGWIFNRRIQYRDSLGKVGIKDGVYTEFRIQARI